MLKHRNQRIGRRGLTMIELLVVIGIMLILAAVAIPTVRFLTRDREIREATRMVNTFLESARNDALATGRAGVMLERSDNDPSKSVKLFKVKFPPPYMGDTYSAQASIARGTKSVNGTNVNFGNQYESTAFVQAFENTLFEIPLSINIGDEIQFGHKGPWFPINTITGIGSPVPHPRYDEGAPYNTQTGYYIRFSLNGYSSPPDQGESAYQIRRQPIKNNSTWVDLPKNTFVDLNLSGFAVRNLNADDTVKGQLMGGGDEFASLPASPKTLPVLVTFRSDGEMDKVYFEYYIGNSTTIYAGPPAASVFFLVGFDNLQNDAQPIDNLLQPANAWVSVSRGHGKVTTGEMNVSNPAGTPAQRRFESRQFARSGVTQGGS